MRKFFALIALMMAMPLAANAENIDYTFVEGGAARHYPDLSPWSKPERRDGAYLRGSIALSESTYAYGDISRTSGDRVLFIADSYYQSYDYNYTLGQVGLGAHHPLNDRTDALIELAYVHLNEGFSTDVKNRPHLPARGSMKVNGARLNLGLREALTEHVEGWLKVGYLSMRSDFDTYRKYAGEVGVQAKITPRWGVVAEAQFLHAITTYQLGVRANF